ncbi:MULTISPECIES: fumarylacetoacetate hydrolase family protein [unclassified Streptomyces]|uniref:fumarylacetoacetate hydrolase family protein n=1 Tax=unclassified Streptomyces TaxID=2593676 RepID=UPI002DDBCABB|nr:fumarylacetoacetate hydrolase family protein [Streptomyces sp. NBC_01257]WRZ69126.1 fumarylacetoacetate hydrolase family protein [Streptomyces sp. NBC_01257]
MRVANIDGRLTLSRPGGLLDVAEASGGRFGPDPQQAFDDWEAFSRWAHELVRDGQADSGLRPAPGDGVVWGPPVPRPAQVFAVGLNYRDHVIESGLSIPDEPAVFTKFATSLTGHDRPVTLPEGLVDWEVELVVVIGRRCHLASRETAWSHVAGVTVGQDLSERRLQLAGPAPQFSLGKSYPGFAPTGPELVTVDELADPDDLEIGCTLEGGEVLQKSRTSNMIFDVPELIVRLSAVCPLLPGDLIFTGTPAGVGGARTPQKFLAPGDVLVSWIEGLGELRNPMLSS